MAQHCDIDHLIMTSTEVILRGWQNDSLKPLTETEPLPIMRDMAGPYSRSKLAAEMATRQAIEAGQPISITYPTVPIGAGDWSFTAPAAMIKNFLYTPPPAILDCSLNFVAAKDIARGHILAAQQPPGGRYILGGQDISMAKFLDYLAPHSQKKLPQKTVPYALAALTAHGSKALSQFTQKAPLASVEGVRLAKYKTYIDSSHARKTLGWKTMAIEAAIDEAAYWIKQHHEV